MEKARGLSGRWILAALAAGALLGALIGGAIGAATYTPISPCDVLCFTRGAYVFYGAILGVIFGPFVGLILWAFWALWANGKARRETGPA